MPIRIVHEPDLRRFGRLAEQIGAGQRQEVEAERLAARQARQEALRAQLASTRMQLEARAREADKARAFTAEQQVSQTDEARRAAGTAFGRQVAMEGARDVLARGRMEWAQGRTLRLQQDQFWVQKAQQLREADLAVIAQFQKWAKAYNDLEASQDMTEEQKSAARAELIRQAAGLRGKPPKPTAQEDFDKRKIKIGEDDGYVKSNGEVVNTSELKRKGQRDRDKAQGTIVSGIYKQAFTAFAALRESVPVLDNEGKPTKDFKDGEPIYSPQECHEKAMEAANAYRDAMGWEEPLPEEEPALLPEVPVAPAEEPLPGGGPAPRRTMEGLEPRESLEPEPLPAGAEFADPLAEFSQQEVAEAVAVFRTAHGGMRPRSAEELAQWMKYASSVGAQVLRPKAPSGGPLSPPVLETDEVEFIMPEATEEDMRKWGHLIPKER